MRVAVVILLLVSFTVVAAGPSTSVRAQGISDLSIEERIVKYLREHLRPGERLIVSDLHNDIFKTPEERKVLDKMFNVFFKIPLFVAQYKSSTNQIPTLADLARQFNLPVPGEVAVLLSIMDDDPRVPKFITRDSKTGEITSVDVEAVRKDRRFGQLLERSLTGWVGRDAAPFSLDLLDGTQLLSDDLKGKNFLLYFWFSGCPPCVRIAPHLVDLQKQFGKKNFTVIAVNADRLLELDTTNDQIIVYGKKAGFNFPVGHLNKIMYEAYGSLNVYPTLFLVDSKGIIRKHYVNYQPLSVLAADLEALP